MIEYIMMSLLEPCMPPTKTETLIIEVSIKIEAIIIEIVMKIVLLRNPPSYPVRFNFNVIYPTISCYVYDVLIEVDNQKFGYELSSYTMRQIIHGV
jgi:hypothetical protein